MVREQADQLWARLARPEDAVGSPEALQALLSSLAWANSCSEPVAVEDAG